MTLSFSTTINGKPNYFIEKIWAAIPLDDKYTQSCLYMYEHINKFNKRWDETGYGFNFGYTPKLHTIRDYRKSKKTGLKAEKQWKAGDNIHPCINNRSPNYFQFAPVIKCKSVQTIEIRETVTMWNNLPIREIHVLVDGKELSAAVWNQLAINDGFDSPMDFINYFSLNIERQLIHWTDLKY